MLTQEGGCTLEDLLEEDEHCLNQCKAANTKLIEFMCQRQTLQKLLQYATLHPTDENNHDVAHKFPFVASDILTSNKQISQALTEGGWAIKTEEEEHEESGEDKKSDQDFEDSNQAENKMVQNILNTTNVSELLPVNRFRKRKTRKKLSWKSLTLLARTKMRRASKLPTSAPRTSPKEKTLPQIKTNPKLKCPRKT